jgi:hypothetical protein
MTPNKRGATRNKGGVISVGNFETALDIHSVISKRIFRAENGSRRVAQVEVSLVFKSRSENSLKLAPLPSQHHCCRGYLIIM